MTVIGRSVTGKAPLNAIVIVARHYDGSNLSQLFPFSAFILYIPRGGFALFSNLHLTYI